MYSITFVHLLHMYSITSVHLLHMYSITSVHRSIWTVQYNLCVLYICSIFTAQHWLRLLNLYSIIFVYTSSVCTYSMTCVYNCSVCTVWPVCTTALGSGYGGIRRRAWGKVHMLRSGKRGDLAPLEEPHENPSSSSTFFTPDSSSNSQYSALMEAGN